VAGRRQTGSGLAFLGANCQVFLGDLGAVLPSSALARMTPHDPGSSHAGAGGALGRSSAITQNLPEHLPWDGRLRPYERQLGPWLTTLAAELDQLFLEGGQRPITDRVRRRQRQQEIAEITGERLDIPASVTISRGRANTELTYL
jgi:hypothetical protein